MSSPPNAEQVAQIIAGLADPTADNIEYATRGYSAGLIAAAAAKNALTGGGGTGPQGPQGDPGPAGPPGADGQPGPTGPPGADSTAPGPAGPSGPQGNGGPQGQIGPQGATGDQGDTGPQGVPGPQGVQGIPGAAGADSTVPGPQGTQGPAGTEGPVGPQGNPGAAGSQGSQGIQGVKGDTGDTGGTGPEGPQGQTGNTGPPGTTSWTGITDKPATFPPDTHNHDSSYYTEAETDTLLAGKVPTTRTVAGKALSSDVALVKADVGLGSVDNTTDSAKPVSGAQQTALDLKAPLASPALTGTPTVPTQTAGDNSTKTASTAYVRAASPLGRYRTILDSTGSHIAARVAGTYGMPQGQPLAITGTGTLYALNTILIAAADYPTFDGLAAKLRIRAQLYTNDVAPTGNFTLGLHPITRPGTSGGAGLCIYTIGSVVAGSNGAAFVTPAADGLYSAVGVDFALPADGQYILGVVTTATVAANAHVHVSAQLQVRNA